MRARVDRGLLHPVALAALVVLIVNDHLLKDLCPCWLTGKLSDVAGLIVFPLVLCALTSERWRRACVVVAIVGFALVKVWEPANAACEAVLGLLLRSDVEIVRDPTDLLALPAALWAWRRRP